MWVLLLCFCAPDHAPFLPVQEAESACVREFRRVNQLVREIHTHQRELMEVMSSTRQTIIGVYGTAKAVEDESKMHARELAEFDKRCAKWLSLTPRPDEPEASWRQRAALEGWRAHVSLKRQTMLEHARNERNRLESEGAHAEAQKVYNELIAKLKAYDQANAAFLPKDGE